MKQFRKTLNQSILIVITILHLSRKWGDKEILKQKILKYTKRNVHVYIMKVHINHFCSLMVKNIYLIELLQLIYQNQTFLQLQQLLKLWPTLKLKLFTNHYLPK